MVLGLTLVVFEMWSGRVYNQLGSAGRVAAILSGTAFSVWGLKEVIASLFPSWTKSSDSFLLPVEGWAYLIIMCVLFIGALIGRSNLLLMVFASMAGPFIMNGWFTFTMLRRLNGGRSLPERVMAGETFTTTIILENRKSWLAVWLMRVLDSVTKGNSYIKPEVMFVRIPPRESRQGHYQLRLHERGRYRFGPMTVTTRFPLGLVQRGTGLDVNDELLVYPRVGTLTPKWRKLLQYSFELVTDVQTQSGLFHDEMSRIREYRAGDDPRMIHWKTSARTNELMVREYEESRDRDLLLIVDCWQPETPTLTSPDEFERGLCFATTVCMEHLRGSRESSLSVRLVGQTLVKWQGDKGESHIDQLLDAFAEVMSSSQIPPEAVVEGLDDQQSRQFRVVLLSARAEKFRDELNHSTESRFPEMQVLGMSAEELSPLFYQAK
ncbi:hypothetical protein KOR42_05000 [Thalassoglobus neptunius]|uniref:DUF58 domain-containing protein n=1 Tax=Thalassoglobus neptunius TaxID=1938619 RepID=A0A5C5X4Z3_9PLAN|nr:DUF58 domain-containing protein [Thalassoglobus neptunius]TWT57142.1 hypothetical protein KOR42_05000 [Thalassoglobus neptunius]